MFARVVARFPATVRAVLFASLVVGGDGPTVAAVGVAVANVVAAAVNVAGAAAVAVVVVVGGGVGG